MRRKSSESSVEPLSATTICAEALCSTTDGRNSCSIFRPFQLSITIATRLFIVLILRVFCVSSGGATTASIRVCV